MESFYINLDKRIDKKALFIKRNGDLLPFCRFSGVDGSMLDSSMLVERGIIDSGLDCYSRGALGCALSHKLLWDYAERQTDPVTIVEDDAVLNRNFKDDRNKMLCQLPADWDIILWGWNFDSILHTNLPGSISSLTSFASPVSENQLIEFRLSRVNSVPQKLMGAFGTVAYTVSPRGAQRLKQCCFPLMKEYISIPGLNRKLLNIGIDVVMNKWYPHLQAYAAFPPLVITKNDKATSDIS
jgi:GR25 family glycosyltransferase involved in LPS biosynthesis